MRPHRDTRSLEPSTKLKTSRHTMGVQGDPFSCGLEAMTIRSCLQFVCLCLTNTPLQGLNRRLFVASRPSFSVMATPNNDFGVGQADIGKQATDQVSTDDESKSWRELLEISSSKSRHIRGSNYVQLATVDPTTGEPRNRCIVFRGFEELSPDHPCSNYCGGLSTVMKMATDDRSQKVRQGLENPTGELVWWFPTSSEQYRVRGELIFVGAGQMKYDNDRELIGARIQQWGMMSDSARESFYHQAVPGDEYAPPGRVSVPVGGRGPDGKLLPPPATFLLMLLMPKHVDYLRLTNMYRQVDKFQGSEWVSTRVNP